MRVRRLATAAVAVLLLGACSLTPEDAAPRPTSRPESGRLPDVKLPGLTSEESIDIGALRGPLVVNVWASFCKPCKRELPLYQGFSEKYSGKVAVLGVDYQDNLKGEALAMIRKAGVDYPNVYDFAGEFRAFAVPKLLLVDQSGEVVYNEFVEIKSEAQLEALVAEHLGVSAR